MPLLETAEGVFIHYETEGEGSPLLFVHGWAMSGKVWRFQQRLANGHRRIMADFRGHGLSSAPDSGYSFEYFARDLYELISHLGLDKTIIIAWSMGVQVALQAFPLIKERLAALVFISGTPKFTAAKDYSYGLPQSEVRGLGLRLQMDYEKAAQDFIRGMFTDEELSHGCYKQMVSERIFGKLPAQHAALASLKSLACTDLRNVLPSIEVPVLLIHGSADIICPPAASHYMAEQLPDARLEIMEGAGHAPFLSRPAEFAEILKKFIDGICAND